MYASAATYNVVLQIHDPVTVCHSTANVDVVAPYLNPDCNADFWYDAISPLQGGMRFVSFAGGTGTIQHTWDFGDGNFSNLDNPPMHYYDFHGIKEV